MSDSSVFSITEGRARLGALAREVHGSRGRVSLTDHGHTIAILISPAELADLEAAAGQGVVRKEVAA